MIDFSYRVIGAFGWRCAVVAVGMLGSTCPAHAGGSPTIFEVLDPVRPDETLLLFGADVTPRATAEGLRLGDDAVSGPPATLAAVPDGQPKSLEVLQATDLSAKVLMPKSWAPGIFAVRLRSATGIGEWLFVNRPQIWWQMSGVGGVANPGGDLRLFGKNFGPSSRVWIEDSAGTATALKVKVARDYDVVTGLPAGLAPGKYRAWLHNGRGGRAGFGKPLGFTVEASDPWPETVFDVYDFGARGNNRSDDTLAINRALAKAGEKGGGVVFLPAGTYLVTGKLSVPARTVLRGESRDSVWIKVPVYWPEGTRKLLPEIPAVVAGNGSFGVENLSVTARSARRLVAAPDSPEAYGAAWAGWRPGMAPANGVSLRNLRLQHLIFAQRIQKEDKRREIDPGPSTVVIKGADFTLEDSEIISSGMPIQIAGATRARLARNVLRTGRNGWYGVFDFIEGVFEENDVAAADLEGSYGGVQGAASRIMFRANSWHDAYGCEREALTFDVPYLPAWMGRVTAEGPRLSLGAMEAGKWPPEPTYPTELLAVIAGGRGVGQAVPVQAAREREVILERPFAIAPDPESLVVIVARKDRVLIVDNAFADASAAIQLYSQSREFLIAGNHCRRTGGTYAHATDYINPSNQRHSYSYALFNQWLDNTFEQGFVFEQGPWDHGYVGYDSSRTASLKEAVPAIGNRLVGNRLLGGTQLGATVPQAPSFAPGSVPVGRDGIFERNAVSRAFTGISVDSGHAFTLLRANAFDRVPEPIADRGTGTLVRP